MFDRAKKRRRRNPQLMSASEVSQATGFTSGAVRYWIAEGQLKAKFDGYRYLIRPGDLKKFLELYYADNVTP